VPPGTDLLFRIDTAGRVLPVTASRSPDPEIGDTLFLLGNGSPAPAGG
jgi:hypothetical protein